MSAGLDPITAQMAALGQNDGTGGFPLPPDYALMAAMGAFPLGQPLAGGQQGVGGGLPGIPQFGPSQVQPPNFAGTEPQFVTPDYQGPPTGLAGVARNIGLGFAQNPIQYDPHQRGAGGFWDQLGIGLTRGLAGRAEQNEQQRVALNQRLAQQAALKNQAALAMSASQRQAELQRVQYQTQEEARQRWAQMRAWELQNPQPEVYPVDDALRQMAAKAGVALDPNQKSLSKPAFTLLNTLVGNATKPMTGGGVLGGTPEEIQQSALDAFNAIVAGNMNPDYRSWMSMRDPRLPALNDLFAKSGVDVRQMQLAWRGEGRGVSSANSPQQLRMRQAAETIPLLLNQLAGPADPNTGLRSGGLYDRLRNSNIQLVNVGGQLVARAVGAPASGLIAQYRVLARKLATEQAFLQAGGNDPKVDAINDNLKQYDATASPEMARGGFLGADMATQSFQRSIAAVGAVTPSNPYQATSGAQNPQGGPQQALGTNPARGTGPAIGNTMPNVQPPGTVRMYDPAGGPLDVPIGDIQAARKAGASFKIGGR